MSDSESTVTQEQKPTPKAKPAKKKASGSAKKKSDDNRKRGRKAYPVLTFEEALKFGQGLLEQGAGTPDEAGNRL